MRLPLNNRQFTALNEKKYRVVDVFSSIQGEGQYLGYGAIFVRFWGCNRHCEFCDTPEALNGTGASGYTEMLAEDLLQKIVDVQKCNDTLLVFTGGEPLLQLDLALLVSVKNHFNGELKICIETNGDLLPEWASTQNSIFARDFIDHISVSPKNLDTMCFLNFKLQDSFVFNGANVNISLINTLRAFMQLFFLGGKTMDIKFVVWTKSFLFSPDCRLAPGLLSLYQNAEKWLQPCAGSPLAVEQCLSLSQREEFKSFRLGLQAHKFWNLK